MMRLVKRRVVAVLMGIALSGCTAATGSLTQTFGTSHELARLNQTLNPKAKANLNPAEGFDGKAAKLALDRYYKSFEHVPPQPSFVLRVSDFKTRQ